MCLPGGHRQVCIYSSWGQNPGWAGGAALGSDRFWLMSLLRRHILYVFLRILQKKSFFKMSLNVLFNLHTHTCTVVHIVLVELALRLCVIKVRALFLPPRAPDSVMQLRQRIPRYIPAPPKDDQPAPLALQQVESARVSTAKRPKKGRKAKNWILCSWASVCMRLTGPT